MAAVSYDATTAQRLFRANRSATQDARIHANEAMLHDMSALGAVEFFEGPGDDPTGLSGYASHKIWLRQSAGVQATAGSIRKWNGGTQSLLASWPVMTRADWSAYWSADDYVTSADVEFATRTAAAAATIGATIGTIETFGYATSGDGGAGRYKRGVSLTSGGFQSADGAYWDLVPDGSNSVYARQFGVKADGSTNDTSAMQACIDYLEAYATANDNGRAMRAYLPAGIIKASGLTIERAVHLVGAGANATRLTQTTGLDTSFISIRVAYDTTNYYSTGNPPPQVIIQGVRVVGQGWSTGFSNNHGLDLQNAASNPITTEVILRDFRVQDFPGHNIYGLSFSGWVEGYEVSSGYAGLDCLHCNSCADWNFIVPQFYLGRYGVLLSGCVNMHFSQINCWSNREHGVYLFASGGTNAIHTATFVQGSIDRNGLGHGVFNDLRNGAAFGARFIGINWSLNSAGSDNSYSDIYFASTSTAGIAVIGGSMDYVTSQTADANHKTKHHVEIHASATGKCYIDPSTHFVGGALSTSAPTRIVASFPGIMSVKGSVVLGDGTASTSLIHNGAAGTTRLAAALRTNGLQRWDFGGTATAESGGNAGTDLFVNSYDDSGAYIETPFAITRSTGITTTKALKSNGNIRSVSPTAGVGYDTGAGGTVTQATSKATGVTLNKVCGVITMNNAALAAGTTVGFTLTNSTIAATDVVLVSIKSGATANSYTVTVSATGAGSCVIELRNTSGGSLSEAVVLNYVVVKGVAS